MLVLAYIPNYDISQVSRNLQESAVRNHWLYWERRSQGITLKSPNSSCPLAFPKKSPSPRKSISWDLCSFPAGKKEILDSNYYWRKGRDSTRKNSIDLEARRQSLDFRVVFSRNAPKNPKSLNPQGIHPPPSQFLIPNPAFSILYGVCGELCLLRACLEQLNIPASHQFL